MKRVTSWARTKITEGKSRDFTEQVKNCFFNILWNHYRKITEIPEKKLKHWLPVFKIGKYFRK